MQLKKIITVSFFVVIFTLLARGVWGFEDARIYTDFTSEYVVSDENTAEAEMTITFTNEGEVSSILSKYNLNIGNIDPLNVEVTYSAEKIPFTMYESNGIIIQMSLGEILLSPDTPEEVVVKYDVSEFFVSIGGAYDVALPIFDRATSTSGGSVDLRFPNSFGSISYSSIDYTLEEGETFSTYNFVSDEVDSVYVSIGNNRCFSLNMERVLENMTSDYVTQEILLPVDSAGQTIVLQNLSPFPDSVNMTDEGNLFLVYNIAPDDTIWVRIQGVVVSKNVEESSYLLSAGQKAVHLDTSMALWKITDENILAAMEELDDGMSTSEKVGWTYEFLMENLNLSDDFRDLHSFEYRKGADIALQTYKNASAEDFADSFIAIARILDIPSRVVSGYVFPYTVGGSRVGIYHVWPQYWSEKYEWISIDPAYELYSGFEQQDCTGLNRVIMAVYPSSLSDIDFEGSSSEMFFTEEMVEKVVDLDVEIEIEDEIQAGRSESGSITLFNNGNTVIKEISFSDLGGDLEIDIDDGSDRTVLLPGESFDYDFTIRVSEWYLSGSKKIKLEVLSQTANGQERNSAEKTVSVIPLKWAEPVTWVITFVLFSFSTWLLYVIYKVVRKYFPVLSSKFKKK